MRMKNIYIKCPQCKAVFNNNRSFWWGSDLFGDPTIENETCPKCLASTNPTNHRRKHWNYEDFKTCSKKGKLLN